MNKFNVVSVALIVAGGIAIAVVENNRADQTQATLAALTKDRAALDRKINDLTRLMAEMRDRASIARSSSASASASASAGAGDSAARQSNASAPPPAVRVEEPAPVPGVSRVAPA